MKKKVKSLLVVLCLIVVAIVLFGNNSSDSGDKKDVVKTEDATQGKDNATNTSKETVSNSKPKGVSIEEQVLVDQNGIVITAKEYVHDSIWGDGIKVLVENNSDKNVGVSSNALIVNNYMVTDLFTADVAAGKKSNETIYISSSDLEAVGIETVGQIEIYFKVYDSNSWNTIFETDCVTIKTSEYANMDTTPDDAGTELYNEGGIRIVGKTVDENSFWGSAILLYCENKSGKNIGISVDDMSINGFMMSPFFTTTVYDEKMSVDTITIFSNDLEANGIESIDEVELKFHIYDADTYGTIADSEPITFSTK